MPLNSIRARMTLAFTVSTALLMLLACGIPTLVSQRAAEQHAQILLESASRKIYDDLTDDEYLVPLENLLEEEQDTLRPDNMALFVVDAQGHIVMQSGKDIPSWPLKPSEEWRLKTLSFKSNTIVLGLPWRTTGQALHRQALLLLLLSLLVTVAATLGAWLLVGRTLSPIGALSRQAQTASVENLHLHLDTPSQDSEIVELVSTLNGLLARVADTAAAKGRFHAAASHELRTPLQALSGHLELALTRPRSEAEYLQFIAEANTHAQRLTALTRDLLLLHQLDAARPTVKTEVNLADICERALRLLAPRIQERGLQVQTLMPEDALIEAAPTHAEMLLRNLIENAVKYATPGGQIRISVCASTEPVQIALFNSCPSLEEGQMDRLFEPFYRPDSARDSDTGGTGLGLAICKAIAAANVWSLTLQQEEQGIKATIVFGSASESRLATL